MLLLRSSPNANHALKTGRGDRGARVKTVRIAGPIPLVFNTDLCPAAPSGHNETSKPGDTGHLVLPATNERRERRLLILGVDLIKRLQAPYTVHERSRDPFRIGVQLRVHAGLPLENLTDKPAVHVAAGDARQKSSRCPPFREGDFEAGLLGWSRILRDPAGRLARPGESWSRSTAATTARLTRLGTPMIFMRVSFA